MEKRLQIPNHQSKIAVWNEHIAAYRNSGISVKTWCEENGISTASYNKWQKKLFCLAAQSSPQFAEVYVAPAAKISVIVHLGHVSVDIHSGTEAETTSMVLQILQGRPYPEMRTIYRLQMQKNPSPCYNKIALPAGRIRQR